MFKKIFLIPFLLSFAFLNLHALEISISIAKENHQNYSILHIKDKDNFLCQSIKNDFKQTIKIVCAFSKSPSKSVHKLKDDFFKVDTEIKDKTFFVIITPYEKMKLFSMIFNLTKDDTLFKSDVKMAKHWMIVGFKDKIPFIKQNNYTDMSINFPFTDIADKFPFVGSLDINGKPVHIKSIEDVSSYLKVKELYKRKQYDLCLDLIDEVIQKYPNTLFLAELLYFKIKVNVKLKNYDNVIDISKVYLQEFSSDENVAEVLALLSDAYAKIGLNTDAEYFFDRLFTEHADTVFAKWGYIYKGDMLESSGGVSKAIMFYKKALNSTKNIRVAIAAAYKLAHIYLANSNAKEAAKFIEKISKAKAKYFLDNFKTSMEMMHDFEDIEYYKSAATIAKALVDNMKSDNDDKEKLMRNVGVWLSKTADTKGALTALNRYLKKYDDGYYLQEVQVAKDSLFFEDKDENLTTKLQTYTKLIKTYPNDSIGNKAVYQKAKLLLKNKMFNKVLELERPLLVLDNTIYKDVNNIIDKAAVGSMKVRLKQKKCKDVLDLSSKYKIKLSNEWDDGIFECAMKGGDFSLAKNIANKNLKSRDLTLRKKWLFRYIKVVFSTSNYKNVVLASKEFIILIEDDKNIKYKEVYRILFDTYQRLGKISKMINLISKIKEIYGENYKDIDRYVAMVNVGDKDKDDNLIIKYAKEVIKIQKKSDSYAQSPFVEFALYQTYINKENYNGALELMESLNNIKLNNTQRARQKYLLGSIYSKLWREDDAQEAYDASIKADKNSSWAKLSKDAKKIR